MQNTADFTNQKEFRYADAILMMAECYAETEDSDEAVRYLNMVRERAGTTAYVFKNKDALHKSFSTCYDKAMVQPTILFLFFSMRNTTSKQHRQRVGNAAGAVLFTSPPARPASR